MATFPDRQVSIAFDLCGCPNRCRHCWLGCATTRTLDVSQAIERYSFYKQHVASGAAKPFLETVRFFATWLREPDYSDDYRDLFRKELDLNGGQNYRKDYELLSIWRLARDPSYARWAYETGVERCQITLFGAEETTDWFYRRKGAFKDAMAATSRLLDSGIVPRWQLFQTKRIIPELAELLLLVERLRLPQRCESLGQDFVAFMHDPSPIGEAMNLESIRITRDDLPLIPSELIRATMKHMKLTDPYQTEREWLSQIAAEADSTVGVELPPVVWFFVDSEWNVYPNLMTMEPWWRLGNILDDPPALIVERYAQDRTPGQRALLGESRKSLAAGHGNPKSEAIFMDKNDLLELYLEKHLQRAAAELA